MVSIFLDYMRDAAGSVNLDDSVVELIKNPLTKALLYRMLQMSNMQHTYKYGQGEFENCMRGLRKENVILVSSHGGNPQEFHFRGRLTTDYLPGGKYNKQLTELCADAKSIENIECS